MNVKLKTVQILFSIHIILKCYNIIFWKSLWSILRSCSTSPKWQIFRNIKYKGIVSTFEHIHTLKTYTRIFIKLLWCKWKKAWKLKFLPFFFEEYECEIHLSDKDTIGFPIHFNGYLNGWCIRSQCLLARLS